MLIPEKEYFTLKAAAVRAQSTLYEVRQQTNAHREMLRNAVPASRPDEEFMLLLQKTFSHHELFEFSRISRADVNIKLEIHVSKWFHQKYFLPVKLTCGTSTDSRDLSVDAFFERVVGNPNYVTPENNIQFLVGEVGDGKTTFLCNLMYTRWQAFVAKNIIPIRLNLDTLTNHTVPAGGTIPKVFLDATLATLELNGALTRGDLDNLKVISRTAGTDDAARISDVLANLVRVVRTRHRKNILYIIDNIDYLYHIGDRGVFSVTRTPEQVAAYEAIKEILKLFSREDQPCARLGLNVLYCIRPDTLDYIDSQHLEVPFQNLHDRVATIVGIASDKEKTLNVIDKRFELLVDLCDGIHETSKKVGFLTQIERIRGAYQARERGSLLFDHLWNLSRSGLREIIEQLANYSWIEHGNDQHAVLTQRFSEQYAPSLLAYVLGGRRRYCQFRGGVPNLYLTNATAPSSEYGVPAEFKADHFCTFWLKRLIMHYLDTKERRFVPVSEFIRTFSGTNGRGYPEDLVRYLAGSLAQVPTSECIKVKMDAAGSGGQFPYVSEITLTKRGRFLIEVFADSFSYLQLAVDDWRLRLPRSLASEFEYVEPDYAYLVADQQKYGIEVTRLLVQKARQAIWFAILLEEYLSLEMRLQPNVFARLRANEVRIPTEGDIVTKLVTNLDHITRNMSSRSNVFDAYCNTTYIADVRRKVRKAAEELAMPQTNLLKSAYGA